MEFHKEVAFHDISPDYLLLYCLRGDRTEKAMTGVASIRQAISILDNDVIAELRNPNFSIWVHYSFAKDKGINYNKKVCILSGDIEDPYMLYDSDLITPLNNIAKYALDLLDKALREKM